MLALGFALTSLDPYVAPGVVRDEVFQKEGFAPFFELATRPPFRGVGTFLKPNAVWIGGRFVLTVAHGFVSPDGTVSPANGLVFTLPTPRGEVKVRATAVHVPKRYVEAMRSEGEGAETDKLTHDLAIIELERPLTVSGVLPAVVNSRSDEVGKSAVFVGFGDRGTSVQGTDLPRFGSGQAWFNDQHGDRTVRPMGFENTVDFEFSGGMCLGSRYDSKKPIRLQGITAVGDSGGGAFAQFDGEWRLIGICHNGLPRPGSSGPTWTKGNVEGSSCLYVRLSRFYRAMMAGGKGDWKAFEES